VQPTTATTGQANAVLGSLLNGPARFAPAWSDWNPTAGGSIHVDVAANNQSVIVTWNAVPENGQGTANTFQCEIDAFGNVEYRYQTVSNVAKPLIVGWTQGAPARDPGNRDLTTALPFVAQADSLPLAGLDYVEAYLVAQPTAAIQFAVPAQPALAGLHVYSQAFSFAATANPFGVILSNGVDLLIDAL